MSATNLPVLLATIRERHPGADATLERFPSGAYIIDVRLHGRLFELRSDPAHGFAIDEITADDAFDCGYTYAAITLPAAAERLLSLLDAAR